jgi:hypothetical protein
MKKYLYLLLIPFLMLSCKKMYEGREPTVFAPTPPPPPPTVTAPPYTAPFCNPTLNNTTASHLNFQLTFNQTPTVTVSGDKTLTFKTGNSQNDRVEIVLAPFVAGQSTVYTLSDTRTGLAGYKAYIEFNADKLNVSTKIQTKSKTSPVTKIYVKYNSSTQEHEMIFCSSPFSFMLGSTPNQTSITGRFAFEL